MDNFKENLEAEKQELEGRLNRLNAFNRSKEADGIDPVQRSLSIVQAGAMYTYLECLKESLARL